MYRECIDKCTIAHILKIGTLGDLTLCAHTLCTLHIGACNHVRALVNVFLNSCTSYAPIRKCFMPILMQSAMLAKDSQINQSLFFISVTNLLTYNWKHMLICTMTWCQVIHHVRSVIKQRSSQINSLIATACA